MRGRTDSIAGPLTTAVGWMLLGLVCSAVLAMAFLVAWRHVRYSPGLVDDWPGGAAGFGLSCAAGVLVGRSSTTWCLRRGTLRARIPGVALCAMLGLLGVLYGLAVVPPRWCYQSTSPSCGSLPGAAEGGLTFLGTLIAAFFVNGALAGVVTRIRRLRRATRTPPPSAAPGADPPPAPVLSGPPQTLQPTALPPPPGPGTADWG